MNKSRVSANVVAFAVAVSLIAGIVSPNASQAGTGPRPGGTTLADARDFALRVRPDTDSVGAGDAGYYLVETIPIPASSIWPPPCIFTADGVPPDATATFLLHHDQGLELQTSTATARGSYDVTITATGAGKTHSAKLHLTVKERAHVTCSASTRSLLYGETCAVSGILTNDETVMPGGSVWLRTVRYREEAGPSPLTWLIDTPWRRVSSETTSAGGACSFVARPSQNRLYRLRYTGDATYADFDSDDVLVRVRPRVSARVERYRVRVGELNRIRTSVLPYHPGRRVGVQRKIAGKWKGLASLRLNSSSRATWYWRPKAPGTCYFRLGLPEHMEHLAGISRTLKVMVTR